MISDPLFLGVDLGTSALKCGLFDLAGNCRAAVRIAYPTLESALGAEQHAADWWQARVSATRRCIAAVETNRIVAICVGGHAPSPAIVDARFQAVAPVMPWIDTRSSAEHDRIIDRLGRSPANGPERLMAQLAARAAWLRRTAPADFARVVSILHSGDYLIARLTGRAISTSPRVDEVLAAADVDVRLLPQ